MVHVARIEIGAPTSDRVGTLPEPFAFQSPGALGLVQSFEWIGHVFEDSTPASHRASIPLGIMTRARALGVVLGFVLSASIAAGCRCSHDSNASRSARASASALASKPVPSATPVLEVPVAGVLHVIGALEGLVEAEVPVSLHGLGERGFLVYQQSLVTVENGLLRAEPGITRGLVQRHAWEIRVLGGTWPDAAFLAIERAEDETEAVRRGVVFRWRKDRWVEVERTPVGSLVTRIAALPEGRVLGMQQRRSPPGAAGFFWLEKSGDRPRPELFRPTRIEGREPPADRLDLLSFAPLPGGGIVAAGLQTGGSGGAVGAVERFEKDAERGKIEVLPDSGKASGFSFRDVAAVSDREIYVAGEVEEQGGGATPYLARYDGEGWKRVQLPSRAPIEGLSAVDGALLVWAGSALLVRSGPDRWERWTLPAELLDLGPGEVPARIIGAWSSGKSKVWVLCLVGQRYVVLGSQRPPGAPRVIRAEAR